MRSFRRSRKQPANQADHLLHRGWTALLASVAWIGLAGPAESGELIERTRAAWREREVRYASFVADWTEMVMPLVSEGVLDSAGRPVPSSGLIYPNHFHMACDGEKARLNRSGLDYSSDCRSYVEKNFTRVFDGVVRKEVFQSKVLGYQPGGFLNDNGKFDEGDPRILPIVLAFRPTTLTMGALDLTQWQETGRRETINEIECDVLECKLGPEFLAQLAIAAAGDYRPLKRTFLTRGIAIRELTIDWQERPGEGFVCRGWTRIERFEDGTTSHMAVVADLKLTVNRPVDAIEFEFRFPTGTIVTHERTQAMAIVRPDGSYRTILPAEWRKAKSLIELITTDPPAEAEPFVPESDRD